MPTESTGLDRYIEPTTLDEAKTEANRLLLEIEDIQCQLGDRNRIQNGQRLAYADYWGWRQKAVYARQKKLEVYRQLKAWIRVRRGKEMARRREVEHGDDPEVRLWLEEVARQAYRLLALGIAPAVCCAEAGEAVADLQEALSNVKVAGFDPSEPAALR